MSNTVGEHRGVGDLLREWRVRRRLSQFELAGSAEISTRHLSFVETGRASPSREMLLRLAEHLDVPLRERNVLLASGGFAPAFARRALDDPALQSARQAVELVLRAHEPFPALAIDRHWNMVAANRAVAPLLAGADESLLQPPVNVLRLSLHPLGLAPRIANLAQWRSHLLERLRRGCEATADPILVALWDELRRFPSPAAVPSPAAGGAQRLHHAGVFVPLELRTESGTLSFLGTTTVFGTPLDVTLDELAIEAFFPADEATARAMRSAAEAESSP